MAEHIHVVVLKDGDLFVAQCVEVDIAAQGATAEQAMRRLRTVFQAELIEAGAQGRNIMDIGPAPASFTANANCNIVERTALVA